MGNVACLVYPHMGNVACLVYPAQCTPALPGLPCPVYSCSSWATPPCVHRGTVSTLPGVHRGTVPTLPGVHLLVYPVLYYPALATLPYTVTRSWLPGERLLRGVEEGGVLGSGCAKRVGTGPGRAYPAQSGHCSSRGILPGSTRAKEKNG